MDNSMDNAKVLRETRDLMAGCVSIIDELLEIWDEESKQEEVEALAGKLFIKILKLQALGDDTPGRNKMGFNS